MITSVSTNYRGRKANLLVVVTLVPMLASWHEANAQFSTEFKLTASDTEDGSFFGQSVFVFGDNIIVGAVGPRQDTAYIFGRDVGGPNNWGEVGKIIASDTENLDEFGRSVSIFGDTVIVGAPSEDGAGSNRGAAYIYTIPEPTTLALGAMCLLCALTPRCSRPK